MARRCILFSIIAINIINVSIILNYYYYYIGILGTFIIIFSHSGFVIHLLGNNSSFVLVYLKDCSIINIVQAKFVLIYIRLKKYFFLQ